MKFKEHRLIFKSFLYFMYLDSSKDPTWSIAYFFHSTMGFLTQQWGTLLYGNERSRLEISCVKKRWQ